jgi:tetratricopeptide (TPR) repeat protein
VLFGRRTKNGESRASEGIEHIRYSLRLSPNDPHRAHWLRFLGEAELELHRPPDAIEDLHKSYVLNPGQPQTLRSLAAAQAVIGQMKESRRYIAELRQAAPHLSKERLLKRPMRLERMQPELARGLRMALSSPAEQL